MMCAFMTPVIKNDWEVFATNKSRHSSGSSQKSNGRQRQMAAGPVMNKRIGELRSMSYHSGPNPPDQDLLYSKGPTKAYHLSTKNSRNASRASFTQNNSDLATPDSAQKRLGGHKKNPSSNSLNSFHNKVVEKLRTALHRKKHKRDEEEKDENGSQNSDDSNTNENNQATNKS